MDFVKKIMIWVVLGAALYFILAFHYIYFGGTTVKILKKSKLTMNYTVFSAQGKPVEKILDIDALREDGIGEILLELGLISEDKLDKILDQYEEE